MTFAFTATLRLNKRFIFIGRGRMQYCRYVSRLFVLWISLYCLTISAQTTAFYPLAQRLSSENGLSQNVVLDMAEDDYGRLWVGTQDGLNLLNNNEFILFHSDQEEYRLSGTTITDLVFDKRGGMWVASEAGLDYIDTTTLQTRVVQLTKGSKGISHLLLHDDSLFYLSEQQLYRYDLTRNESEKVSLPATMGAIYTLTPFDSQHILLLGERHLGKFNIASGQLNTVTPNIPTGVYKALHIATNRMWISLRDQGLFSCNLAGLNCKAYSKATHALPTNNIARIIQKNEALYLATDKGIGRLNLNTDDLEWIYPHSQNKAYQASQIARALLPTAAGDIFVGTFNGLYRIPSRYKEIQAFNTGIAGYPEGQLAVNVIHLAGQDRLAIAEPNQITLWTLDAGLLTLYRHFPYPSGFEPIQLQVDEGMIYLSSLTAGNLMLDPQSGDYHALETRFPQLGKEQLANMDAPEADIRVFHTESIMKVYQRKNGQWLLKWQKHFAASSATVNYWQGRLYVATYQDGLMSAAMDNHWQEPTSWQQHYGLGIVINLFANAGKLYVLTANLGIFQVHSSQPVSITKVPASEQFGSQTLVCAVSDKDGRVLLSGHKGLSILDRQDQFMSNLTALQGVHEQEFAQFNCGKINGTPYFAGAGGITLVHNSQLSQLQAPSVKWTHLEADNINQRIDKNHINTLTSPSFIRLHFIATPSDLPKQASYRYRIKSLSDKWIEVKSSFISLTNLRPGNYQVELKVRDFTGLTGEVALTTLEIMPVFWESPLAITAYILLGLLVIAALVALKHKGDKAKLALEVAKNRQQQDYSRQLEQEVHSRTQELAQKKQEAEEANTAKTRFIAAASHDLKHPINLMRLQLGQLNDAHLGKKIDTNLGFLEQLVSSIVELSRIDAKVLVPQIMPLDLTAFCHRVAEEHQALLHHHGLCLDLHISPELWVASDALLLRRVLDNILNNAIKISDKGTTVSIHVTSKKECAMIQISDQGPGMTAQMQAQLFTPFKRWTNRYPGSGLGLSVVKGISELLNIQLTLVSELGQGCCFSLSLPVITAPAKVVPTASSLQVGIIEDDKEQLFWLSDALIARGLQVNAYPNAEALLQDDAALFDVILSDIDLGTQRDGLDYLDDYRQRLKGPKLIIYLSGNPESASRIPKQADLFFFAKPVKLGKLMWLINQSQRR